MSEKKIPIFKGANNEEACKKVMGNLKFKGECLEVLHARINKSLELIETMIVNNPTEENKMLLLETMEIYNRKKCVATWKEPFTLYDDERNDIIQLDKDGKIIYEKKSLDKHINAHDWQVSITNKKTVRVHLKDKYAEALRKLYSITPDVKDLTVY